MSISIHFNETVQMYTKNDFACISLQHPLSLLTHSLRPSALVLLLSFSFFGCCRCCEQHFSSSPQFATLTTEVKELELRVTRFQKWSEVGSVSISEVRFCARACHEMCSCFGSLPSGVSALLYNILLLLSAALTC